MSRAGGKKTASKGKANGRGAVEVPPPLTEKVAQLAHGYWEAEGRPEGKHLEHWFRAETELAAEEQNGAAEE